MMDDDDEMSVSLVEETGVPGGKYRSTASNWRDFHTHGPCSDPVPKLQSSVNPGDLTCHEPNALAHL